MPNCLITSASMTAIANGSGGAQNTPFVPSIGDVYPLSIVSSTAGRIGFYVDYSELATTGTHKFYVCRTHGTSGAVDVSYSSLGDSHTSVSGMLSWPDGDASIREVVVTVASKSAGDHRMYLQLSSPTNGAVLHNGDYTRAYGVIDDATIAGDSDSVFYDSAAGVGTGTQADPYGSLYTAIANAGSKRYIYCKGVLTPDGTNTASNGFPAVDCIDAPATRASEDSRVYIRNWPGFTFEVDGLAETNNMGFYTLGGESYHTYRGIDFKNLDCTGVGTAPGAGIYYHYGSSSAINIEHCTADNINGSANNGAWMLWGVDGGKIWRCSSNNIQKSGDTTNTNTAALLTYQGKNLSMQRCTAALSAQGVYHKQTILGDVSTSARFNIFDTNEHGVYYGTAGGADPSHSYTICQSNLIKNSGTGLGHSSSYSDTLLGTKHWWCGNVFDSCGAGEVAAVHFHESFASNIFNNIMLDCRKVWANYIDDSALGEVVEYADYNHEFGTTLTSQRYEYRAVNYSTAAALDAAFVFAANDIESDPLFTNTAIDDYTLQIGSPALTTGIGGSEKGLYFTGLEVIGL